MKPWIERHPIVSFYIVAYIFSWCIAVPLALQTQGVIATRLPLWLHYLTAFGPAAAVVSTGVIVFAIGILLACPSRTLVMRSVHATKLERSQPLPGDEIIPDPIGEFTHGITIAASRSAIWPWLVQMGSTRAGWYSYDRLDNDGAPSADRILTAFQTTAPGTLFPALPGVTEGFVLIATDCERWLILGWPNANGGHVVSWTFVMREQGPHRTRLLVRARGSKAYRFHKLPAVLGIPVVRFVHFVMERKQLLGIARRAERLAETVASRQRAAGSWNLVFENWKLPAGSLTTDGCHMEVHD
jgi:hypothetical protein